MQQPIRLELPFTSDKTTVNAYLFLTPEPTLIDTGDLADDSWDALVAGLAAHGLAPADLRRILITHTHIDHFGQAARLTAESDARVAVLDVGYDWLTDFTGNWTRRFAYYRDVFIPATGMPAHLAEMVLGYSQRVLRRYRSVPADRVDVLTAGQTLRLGDSDWTVLHMPGHAPMQTCFYAPGRKHFLASDMLLARTPTPVLEAPGPHGRRSELIQYLASLQRVEAMEIDLVYPGHGPSFIDHRDLIARQLARIDKRRDECFGHLQAGASTAHDLHQRMYPLWAESLNMAGLWMIIGYLDLLEAAGRVSRTDDRGLWRYAPVR